MTKGRMTLLAAAAALAAASTAAASAPPVGPLPDGPTRTIGARTDAAFTISLPKPKGAGLVWRLARRYDPGVARQTAEGETATAVWIRFRADRAGRTSIVYALTRGERRHAYAARTFVVRVRG